MCAVPLKDLHKDDMSLEQLQALQKLIKKRIPVGAPGCRLPEVANRIWCEHAKQAAAWLYFVC